MINEKLGLFTYYDFEFKRNFVLNELNRVLDTKLNELGISVSRKVSLKEKVDMKKPSKRKGFARLFFLCRERLHIRS